MHEGREIPRLPEGYFFDENGLGRKAGGKGGGQLKICCDSIPTDIGKVILKNDISQTTQSGYRFSVENVCGDKSEAMICTVEEMRSGKLLEMIFSYVNFGTYPGAKKEACSVFEQIIKAACIGKKAVEVYVNKFGWNGTRFRWSERIESDVGKEYADGVEVCELAIGHDVIITALIGAIHGFMKKLLQEADIRHDYVDMVAGRSGIGKSAALKMVCDYRVETGNIYSVGSNRKAVRMQMERNTDQTVVLDDFCKTKSERVSATQEQLVSEIIQAASDAAKVFIDRDSKSGADMAVRRHIMLSAERIILNESTINRCFILDMEEPLSQDVFRKMNDFANAGGFFRFLVAVSRFVSGDNFTPQVEMLAKDYERYKNETDKLGTCTPGSDNRINETYAVQMVLVRVVIRYLKSLNPDEVLFEKTETAFTNCIEEVCKKMKTLINEINHVDMHKKYLIPLAEIICYATDIKDCQGYYVYGSEEKYQKNKERKSNCLLFCVHDGYASFEGKSMCEVMEKEYGLSGANSKGLASDLQYYSLSHVDGEGKLCCRWGTKKRYYHVRVNELLELTCSEKGFVSIDYVNKLFRREE